MALPVSRQSGLSNSHGQQFRRRCGLTSGARIAPLLAAFSNRHLHQPIGFARFLSDFGSESFFLSASLKLPRKLPRQRERPMVHFSSGSKLLI